MKPFRSIDPEKVEEMVSVYRTYNKATHDSFVTEFAGVSETVEDIKGSRVISLGLLQRKCRMWR